MDLRSDYPYWLLESGLPASYPSLHNDTTTDVAIIGAGVTGALAAWYLRNTALKVLVLERRHAGMGSTAATTGLLQYEIDTPLASLQQMIGSSNANRCYMLCKEAIDELSKICKRFPLAEFKTRPSLQYASSIKHVKALQKEYLLRKQLGIDLEWLSNQDIKSRFGFQKQAALLSKSGAEINAYAFTHALLKYCEKKNAEVYDHTEIKTIRRQGKSFKLTTSQGINIKAGKIVIACGYESANWLPRRIENLHTTYAIVSEPVSGKEFWYGNALIWETAVPYLYCRTTKDSRIVVGGLDDDFSAPFKRDRALPRKAKMLEASFLKLFPHLPFITDFKWAGVFGSTKDGLPYVGNYPSKAGIYFSLGFGGNGIVFGVSGARIIRDLINGRPNKNISLFSFSR